MLTDNQHSDATREQQTSTDAKKFCCTCLDKAAYRQMKRDTARLASLLPDDDAAENRLWVLNANMLYENKISQSRKDFVPYKLADSGEWQNSETKWPHLGIFCHGKKFDPFGLMQGNLSEHTIADRNGSIRAIFKKLETEAPFYVDEAPFYPWLENTEAVSAVIKADPCNEEACDCRNFTHWTSIIKMFCRALDRTDLFDKYSDELKIHCGPKLTDSNKRKADAIADTVEPAETTVWCGNHVRFEESSDASTETSPKPLRGRQIKALSPEIQEQIKNFGTEQFELFNTHNGEDDLAEFQKMCDPSKYHEASAQERKDFHRTVENVIQPAFKYLIVAMNYEDVRPLRNELPKFRYWSTGLNTAEHAQFKVTEDECRLVVPKQNKTYEQLKDLPSLAGTRLHKFLLAYYPFAKAAQEEFIREHGDGCTDSPYLLFHFDKTNNQAKCPFGKAPYTGFTNFRNRMYKTAKIEIPKYHKGCVAARHTSAVNDSLAMGQEPLSKKQKKERKEQADESGNSATTREEAYNC